MVIVFPLKNIRISSYKKIKKKANTFLDEKILEDSSI